MSSSINLKPTESLIYDSPITKNWSMAKLCAFVFFVGTCFWLIDHDFFASQRYLFAEEIFEVENYTADAIEQAGLLSAPSRILLGFVGISLILLPTRLRLQPVSALSICLLLLFVFLIASFAWSANPRVTLQKSVSFTLLLIASLGAAKHFSLRELIRVIPGICLGYIAFGLLVELGLGTFKPWQSQYRLVGTAHPNTLAVYASVCCLAATAFRRKAGDSMLWPLLFAGVGILTLLLTKSRTTMAALLLALSSLGYLQLRGMQRAFVISTIFGCLAVFGMILSLQSTSTLDSFAESLALGRTENVSNLTGRLPLWEELSRFVARKPFLGYGYLAFWDSARVQYLSDALGWEIPHGHNMYIDLMLDGGVVGLTLFVGLLFVTLGTAVDRYRLYGDAAIACVFGLVIFAMAHGSAESLFKLPTFLLFTLFTLILRLGFLPRDNSQPDSRLSLGRNVN